MAMLYHFRVTSGGDLGTTCPKFVSLTDFIEDFDWKYSNLDII
jgi:hypothetical protein